MKQMPKAKDAVCGSLSPGVLGANGLPDSEL